MSQRPSADRTTLASACLAGQPNAGLAGHPSAGPSAGDEEDRVMADPRFPVAVQHFNAGEWYACHDGFEELWHEAQGPIRPVLQGILQIAVAHLHLESGNLRGATVLMGEGVGRLGGCGDRALGLGLEPLRQAARERLGVLQAGQVPGQDLPLPKLLPIPFPPPHPSPPAPPSQPAPAGRAPAASGAAAGMSPPGSTPVH